MTKHLLNWPANCSTDVTILNVPSKNIVRCVIFGICVLQVVAVMGYLMREGRLAIVPIYDDVAYLVDGMKRLAVLDRSGFWGVFWDFGANPAHAPFSSLTSTFGFLLSGGAIWGPYFLNGMWVVVVAGLALLVLKQLDGWSRIGIVVAMLASPMFGVVVTDFRPDPVWGLVIGFTLATIAASNLAQTPDFRIFALGLLMGVAILTKPTAFPASALVLIVALLVQLSLSCVLEQKFSLALAARKALIAAAGMLLIVAPYAFTSGPRILSYIFDATGSDIWRTKASGLEHLTFYLNRATGTMMLGWVWYAAAPIILVCGVAIIRSKESRARAGFAALITALILIYLILTISKIKTPLIGSILYGSIVATVVWSLGFLSTRFKISGALVFVLGVCIFLTQWTPRTGVGVHRSDPNMIAVDRASKATFPLMMQALQAGARSVLVSVPGPVYDGTMDLMARQEGFAATFVTGYNWDTWEMFAKGAASSDVVILAEPGMLGQSLGGFTFPSVQFQDRLLKLLSADAAFTGKSVFSDPQGRSVWVFIRKGFSN